MKAQLSPIHIYLASHSKWLPCFWAANFQIGLSSVQNTQIHTSRHPCCLVNFEMTPSSSQQAARSLCLLSDNHTFQTYFSNHALSSACIFTTIYRNEYYGHLFRSSKFEKNLFWNNNKIKCCSPPGVQAGRQADLAFNIFTVSFLSIQQYVSCRTPKWWLSFNTVT